jgi:hypothetical protein
MQFPKVILSYCLLLIYFVGFAHDLIPHCHDLAGHKESIQANHHHHEHHSHNSEKEKKPNHSHIPHGDHIDEGIYDLIVCLLSEAEHFDSICGAHLLPPHGENSKGELTSNKLFKYSTVFSLGSKLSESLLISRVGKLPRAYLSPSVSEFPHRGPPFFSC